MKYYTVTFPENRTQDYTSFSQAGYDLFFNEGIHFIRKYTSEDEAKADTFRNEVEDIEYYINKYDITEDEHYLTMASCLTFLMKKTEL